MCDTYARSALTHTTDSTKKRQKQRKKNKFSQSSNRHYYRNDIQILIQIQISNRSLWTQQTAHTFHSHSVTATAAASTKQWTLCFGVSELMFFYFFFFFFGFRTGTHYKNFKRQQQKLWSIHITHDSRTAYALPVIQDYKQTDRSDEAIKFHAPRQKHLKFHVYSTVWMATMTPLIQQQNETKKRNEKKNQLQSVNAIIVVTKTTFFPKCTKRSSILFMCKARERSHTRAPLFCRLRYTFLRKNLS